MVSAAVATNDWMEHGDRTHPNLKLIDKLKDELTYDGHEKDLREMEECHLRNESPYHFDWILHRVTETEKMSKGDRTHPNLARLDKLKGRLTYDGWREDFEQAEEEHIQYEGSDFDYAMNMIARKQKIHDGDRSDAVVQFLDSLHLTYPGWEKHWEEVFDTYLRGYDVDKRFCLTERQRMHEGDRSHPRLAALDSLRLSYPGWEEDVKSYEERHVSFDLKGFELYPEESSVQIEMFKSKQETHSTGVEDTSWMHPDQLAIINTKWTFPGWEQEVQSVRESTATRFFDDILELFQVRQMLYENDYTQHPLLIKINSIEFSYPDWNEDMENIKREIMEEDGNLLWKERCEKYLQEILNKQRAYNGYLRSMIRDIPGDEDGSTDPKESQFEGNAEKTGVKECVVCWVAPRTHVFVPCGHMCTCKSCSKAMIGSTTKCPACNQTATASIEVFFP
ncbi:hypothetical protein ACHAWC_007065 [Mediolabrus comicus]